MFELFTGDAKHLPRRQTVPLLTSVAAEVLVIVAVIVLPLLIVTEQLPEIPGMMAFVAAPPPPPPPPPAPAPAAKKAPRPTPESAVAAAAVPLEPPSTIEPEAPVERRVDETASGGVEGGIPGGIAGGVLGGLPSPEPPPPPPPPAPSGPVRIGGNILAPTLVTRVNPVYPGVAVSAHLEGIAVLEAVVDEEGRVTQVKILRSAHPLLDPAAIRAVKLWRYSPLTLNGIKVKFVLTVTLSFSLQEAGS